MTQNRPLVMHVPYTFFPEQSGGTEVYVAGLITAMRDCGFEGVVAAPANDEAEYDYQGIPVHRFKRSTRQSVKSAYGVPDEVAAESFRSVIQRLRPDIVHLHAFSAAVSASLVDTARMNGAATVFTYHTPTVSCARGTMMLMGKTACDGVLDIGRCTVCTLQKHGVPEWLGILLSKLPSGLAGAIARTELSGNAATALAMRARLADVHARFRAFIQKIDCVVAVCEWVRNVLLANGVAGSRLVLCRQGLNLESAPRTGSARQPGRKGVRPLRLAYFGRLDSFKGLDIVLDAIRLIPDVALSLDIYGIVQPGAEDYASRLNRMADSRVAFREPLQPRAVPEAMADCDFVVVPSRWLESGPLVVYEAFAAGTPIIGTRIGGIAEIVAHGRDGVLLSADPESWAQTIAMLAADPGRVAVLRSGVRPPRTMQDVAAEMTNHYRHIAPVYA